MQNADVHGAKISTVHMTNANSTAVANLNDAGTINVTSWCCVMPCVLMLAKS